MEDRALHMANLSSIPSIPYGMLDTARSDSWVQSGVSPLALLTVVPKQSKPTYISNHLKLWGIFYDCLNYCFSSIPNIELLSLGPYFYCQACGLCLSKEITKATALMEGLLCVYQSLCM